MFSVLMSYVGFLFLNVNCIFLYWKFINLMFRLKQELVTEGNSTKENTENVDIAEESEKLKQGLDGEGISSKDSGSKDIVDENENGFQLPHNLSVRAWISQCYQNIRPWTTFFNTSHFKPPPGVPQLTRRLMQNAAYFQGNYLVIIMILTLYCLITTPLLLLAVCGSLAACYFLSVKNADKPMTVFGHRLSISQQYALVAGCSLPIYILAGAGSAMFWVLGASMFFTTLHAAFFNIAAITEDKNEQFDGIMEQI